MNGSEPFQGPFPIHLRDLVVVIDGLAEFLRLMVKILCHLIPVQMPY